MEAASDNGQAAADVNRKIKLEFSKDASARLDKMRGQVEGATNGTLARDALRAYRWYFDVSHSKEKLLVERDGEYIEIAFNIQETPTDLGDAKPFKVIELEFSETAFADYEKIRGNTGLSNAELFREAFRFYEWYLDQKAASRRLCLQKENGDITELEIVF